MLVTNIKIGAKKNYAKSCCGIFQWVSQLLFFLLKMKLHIDKNHDTYLKILNFILILVVIINFYQ